MARDDHARALRCRPIGKFRSVVEYMNAYAAQLHGAPLGNARRPRLGIVVAADRIESGNRPQLAQDTPGADISCVDDAVRILEECFCFGPQQTVRVGNQADPDRASAGRPRCAAPARCLRSQRSQ